MTYGQLKAGRRVLEIGCGTGMFTAALAQEGAEVVAFDLSFELLQQIHGKALPERVRVFVGDIEHLPLPDQSFDLVAGVSVLHHLNLQPAFEEIKRVLKPGGRIVFSEPNMLNPQIFVQKRVPLIKRWLGDSPDETAFFRWSLARCLAQEGFTDVMIVPFDFLHPWTPPSFIRAVAACGAFLEALPVVREFAGSLLITGALRG